MEATTDVDDAFPFLIAFGLFVLVPLVGMLLRHQQRMANILHSQQPQQQVDPALLNELARLRDIIAQQSIALDNLQSSQRRLELQMAARPEQLSDRLIERS